MSNPTCLDLDVASSVITERLPRWTDRGLQADDMTWTNDDDVWPVVLHSDRSEVRSPRSLGVHIHGSDDSELQVVLYSGGWADLNYLPPGLTEPVINSPELASIDEFADALDRAVDRLLADLDEAS